MLPGHDPQPVAYFLAGTADYLEARSTRAHDDRAGIDLTIPSRHIDVVLVGPQAMRDPRPFPFWCAVLFFLCLSAPDNNQLNLIATRSATKRPMPKEAVAAGDGALIMCTMRRVS